MNRTGQWKYFERVAETLSGTEYKNCGVQLSSALGRGRGLCRLRTKHAAGVVQDALLHGDGRDYQLLAWVVMPNHLHVVLRRAHHVTLAMIVRRWKSWTARRINELFGSTGPVWQRDYHDTWLRDAAAVGTAIRYVEMNPIAAGLCRTPCEWPFSSARRFPERSRGAEPPSRLRQGWRVQNVMRPSSRDPARVRR